MCDVPIQTATVWNFIDEEVQKELQRLGQLFSESSPAWGSTALVIKDLADPVSILSRVASMLEEYHRRMTQLRANFSDFLGIYYSFLQTIRAYSPSEMLRSNFGSAADATNKSVLTTKSSSRTRREMGTNTDFTCSNCSDYKKKLKASENELKGALLLKNDLRSTITVLMDSMESMTTELQLKEQREKQLLQTLNTVEEAKKQWTHKESRLKGEAVALRMALQERERTVIELQSSVADFSQLRQECVDTLSAIIDHNCNGEEMIKSLETLLAIAQANFLTTSKDMRF